EQHQRNHRERSVFGNFSGFVERDLVGHHAGEVDPLGKSKGAGFGTETGQPVNTVVLEAPVAIAGRVVQYKKLLWECLFET
ncbi:hypothetical protein ABTL76_19730, partial [Acinetobacter baumannii]